MTTIPAIAYAAKSVLAQFFNVLDTHLMEITSSDPLCILVSHVKHAVRDPQLKAVLAKLVSTGEQHTLAKAVGNNTGIVEAKDRTRACPVPFARHPSPWPKREVVCSPRQRCVSSSHPPCEHRPTSSWVVLDLSGSVWGTRTRLRQFDNIISGGLWVARVRQGFISFYMRRARLEFDETVNHLTVAFDESQAACVCHCSHVGRR